MPPAIVVDHLSKRYGSRLAVDGVSFEVASGEVLGLLGPNGSGKTTILRMLTGYSTVVFWLVADGFWAGLEVHEAHTAYYGFPTACASSGRCVDAKVVQVGLLVAPMA